MSGGTPHVSVIIPCRNERDYIASCLDSVLASTYPPERMEILVVDGMSDDGTRGVLAHYAARDARIHVLDNPERITPAALNTGVRAARGRVIVRMDAHNEYTPTYIGELVDWLERSGADNVGGSWQTEPGRDSDLGRAIAVGLSHPFGVGNAHFRIGASEPRWVDTVPFGCYRREVFDRIGLFDPDLVRNQDDEFNARLTRNGGRILLVPQVVSRYYARPSLRKLWRMYYQYGYFKPLAIRKLGSVPTLRQLVPGAFVGALLTGLLLAPWTLAGRLLLGASGGAYLAALTTAAAASATRRSVATSALLFVVFPVLHLSYGIGFLHGVLDFVVLARHQSRRPEAVPLSR